MFEAMLDDWKEEREAVERANAEKNRKQEKSKEAGPVIAEDEEGIFGLTNLDLDDSASATQ